MLYEELSQKLLKDDFERVERDDRLLDIFPNETRAKGVELWVRFNTKTVDITRVRLLYKQGSVTNRSLSRSKVESALRDYQQLELI